MARSTRPLSPFGCTECGTTLGYTAPGESVRMQQRAHVFCATCMKTRPRMTERMDEMINVAVEIRDEKGAAPTYAEIADAMGLSTSRIQNLAASIRAKGFGDELHRALYGHDPISESV